MSEMENDESKEQKDSLAGFEKYKAKRRAKKEERERKEAEKSKLQNAIETIVFAVVVCAIALVIKHWVGQPIIVDGTSMTDTLTDHDLVWANKLFYTPERFDVVIVQPYLEDDTTTSANETKTLFIKRILAMPGESIYIDANDKIHIKAEGEENFSILDDPYGYFAGDELSKWIVPNTDNVSEDYTPGTYTLVYNYQDEDDTKIINGVEMVRSYDIYAYTLTDDEYFCVGDNRYNSHDSRASDLGAFSKTQIKGHAVFRLWPLTRIGNFDKSNVN